MMRVHTARGQALPVAELGETLMHEHLLSMSPDLEQNLAGDWPTGEARIQSILDKLEAAYAVGVRSIVDLTVIGLGRDIGVAHEVAQRSPVNIVAATGFYTFYDIPMYYKVRGPGLLLDGPDPMTELMVGDLTTGIAGSDIRAGIIKCATDTPGVTPGVERILRAAAQAHVQTNAPISTHADAGTRRGLEQIEIFRAEGVDLERVVIGHSGDSTDLDYLHRLLDHGVTLGMDRFGIDFVLDFDSRVDTVARLAAEGFSDQLVLSHDAAAFSQSFGPALKREHAPNWHFEHVHRDVVPALQARGVTDEQVRTMLVDNPARILGH